MHEILFNVEGLDLPELPKTRRNIAPEATVEASSTAAWSSLEALNDGVIAGAPGDTSREWVSDEEKELAWVKLTIDEVSHATRAVGLAEMEVYEVDISGGAIKK